MKLKSLIKASLIKALFFLCVVTLNAQTNNETEDSTPISKPRVRVVFLKTTDVTITTDKIDRLRDIGEYTEDFYTMQLVRKGYTLPNLDMYARNTDGDILIYTVETTVSSTNLTNITNTGMSLAKAKYTDLTDNNSIWAIVHFKDGGGKYIKRTYEVSI